MLFYLDLLANQRPISSSKSCQDVKLMDKKLYHSIVEFLKRISYRCLQKEGCLFRVQFYKKL